MASSIKIITVLVHFVSLVLAAPSFDSRIVGGLMAPEHSFPFIVGLRIFKSIEGSGSYWCGGSLIARNFILTAAHCVHGDTTHVKVKLGTHERTDIQLAGELIDVSVEDITIHKDYNPKNIENDIALIELPLNVTLTDDIQLIKLASRYMDEEFLEGQCVTAAGWGKTVDVMTGISTELRYVDLTIISQAKCQESYDGGIITSKNICIDGSELKGTCNGDSGGPLVYQAADDSSYLVGLTSFGSDHGCEKGFPTAFTRITSFLEWIAENTGIISF